MAVARDPWKESGLVRGIGIPAPSGQYRVGCVDLMHQLPEDERGLLVRLHYPTEATPQQGYQYSPWMANKKYPKAAMAADGVKLPGLWSVVVRALMNPKIPALEGAPIFGADIKAKETTAEGQSPDEGQSAAAPTFPVVVFSHGLKAFRTMYTGIACDIASHGYVVACVEHRDGSAATSFQRVPKPGGAEGEGPQQLQDAWIEFQFHDVPDRLKESVANAQQEFPLRNKQVKQRADEVKKSLDILCLLNEGGEVRNMMVGNYDFKQFKGRMDTSTAAVMGHSFGGGTTVQTLSEDTRFKCGIALDTWMIPIASEVYSNPSSISQPLYFINTYSFQWQENMKRMLPLTKPVDQQGISPCRVLTLNDTDHLYQCDYPFAVPKAFQFGYSGSKLDVEVAHKVNMDICHAFLKRHLLKDPAYQQLVPDLDGTEGHSQHIIFGTNVDMADKVESNVDPATPTEPAMATPTDPAAEVKGQEEDKAEVEGGEAAGGVSGGQGAEDQEEATGEGEKTGKEETEGEGMTEGEGAEVKGEVDVADKEEAAVVDEEKEEAAKDDNQT